MSGSPDPVVRSLALFLTESCNLACSYCFASNMERRTIDEGVARRAIDLMLRPESPADRFVITFWGGEPLLEFPLMQRLVTYAEARAEDLGRQVKFSVPTNLTRLTPQMLDWLLEHQVGLSLSLDGDESAQALRPLAGGGSSAPIIAEKLELLKDRLGDALPGVRMTVSPQTAPEFRHHVHWFLDRGFQQVYFAPVLEAEWSDEVLGALEREQAQLVEDYATAFEAKRPFAIHTWDKALAWRALDRKGKLERGQRMLCGAGASTIAVDIYGDLYPCHRYVFYDKADRDTALGSVAQGLPDPAVLRDYGHIDRDQLGTAEVRCRDCPDEGHCYAYCPALNYALARDRYRMDERVCRFARLEHRMVTQLEARLGDDPRFQRFVEERLLKVFAPGLASAELAAMLGELDDAAVDRLADRAAAIFDRLKGFRGETPR